MNNTLLYQCVVMDNNDPMMLGRVRARLLTDNYDDIIRSIDNPPWNEKKDIWGQRDPFIFTPLLPYFLYQVPKKDELIQILYFNKDFKYQNQYYIQSNLSTPTSSLFEYYVNAQKFTGLGRQFTNPLPLKNQDGTYASSFPKGVFPEPGDNALMGRNSADVIVKDNEVLLRAGKIIGDLQTNVIPTKNNTRAFLQLSRFNGIKQFQENKKYATIKEDAVATKYLIEWTIVNPENSQNKFTGSVYLYGLKPDQRVLSTTLQVDSQIEDLKSLVYSINFTALSIEETIKLINDFIKYCNDNNTIKGQTLFPNTQNKFPIFYRPTNSMYQKMSTPVTSGSTTSPISNNIQAIYTKIKLNSSAKTIGYGLIYQKNKVGKFFNIKKEKVPIYKYNTNAVTFAGLGADKLALLSHYSAIPGKGKINFSDTLYGIDSDKFSTEIIPKTSSVVRGEELLELINKIVRFLITHTHAYPGLPPTPVTEDGSTTQEILSELQNAVNKILNEHIRIN